MKKFLFLFLFLFMGISSLNAETIYGDYKEPKISYEEIKSSDTVKVEEDTLYELYEEKMDIRLVDDPKDYEVITKEYHSYPTSREEATSIKYEYTFNELANYDYIYVENISSVSLQITKFILVDRHTGNIILDDPNPILNPRDRFFIDYEENLGSLELILELDYLIRPIRVSGTLEIGLLKNDKKTKLDEVSYYTPFTYTLDFDNYNLEVIDTYSNIIDIKPLYSYQELYFKEEVMYLCYVPVRLYLNEYSKEDILNYKVDYDHPKKIYKYQERDKLVIEDNIIITNKDTSLLDFVSNKDIKYTSNIDYDINGIYKVNYLFNDKTITKDVYVSIEENYIDLINKQASMISDLNIEVDKNNYLVDKKNYEIKEIIRTDTKEKDNLSNELNNCYEEVKTLRTKKEKIEEETKVKEESTVYLFIILGIIIFLIGYRIKNEI